MNTEYEGQYKVPGGKLVRANFSAEDGIITAMNINGDFFLDPDEALEDINNALIGLPVNTPRTVMIRSIEDGLRAEAALHGFDAEAIATAVRRGAGFATTWDDHQWDVIPPTPMSAAMHVAVDEVLTRDVGDGTRNPTLRFWEWEAPSIVIGSFQSLANEVDAVNVEKYGVGVVRRISGGGAMFMEAGNAITYSLYVPQTLVDGLSYADSYPFLDSWVMDSLGKLGINAFYKPLNDIATDQGKIGGAAQKRMANGGLLHHVTMSYDMNAEKMVEVLRIGREKLSDKGIKSAVKRVDPLKRQTGLSREEIIQTMMDTFVTSTGATPSELSAAERAEAEELVATKFATEEWTARVP